MTWVQKFMRQIGRPMPTPRGRSLEERLPSLRATTDDSTLVYFIRDTATGSIKIGHHADNPKKRFKVIAADNACAELIGYVRAKHQLEVALYEELDADKAANGWFKPSPNVTKAVNLVMNNFERR
jgi:hypothetical protein